MEQTEYPSDRVVHAWLVPLTGPQAGTKHMIQGDSLRIGRDPSNDLVPGGERAGAVSGKHLKIVRTDAGFKAVDLNSTNGTYVDDEMIKERELVAEAVISLGKNGPRFQFFSEEASAAEIHKTLIGTAVQPEPEPGSEGEGAPAAKDHHDTLLVNAVSKARKARETGDGGQTAVIMREMLDTAIIRSRKRLKWVIALLVTCLIAVSLYSLLTIQRLKNQKTEIDTQINKIEMDLASANDPDQIESLIQELNVYQTKARDIQKNILYQLGVRDEEEDFIHQEIRLIMTEFQAESYSIPPEFAAQVRKYVNRFTGKDRLLMERSFTTYAKEFNEIRQHLEGAFLPPDLAYIVLVETGFRFNSRSRAGAAGPWQFVPRTARAYGLTVNRDKDERFDLEKSTVAAARYIRHLIVEFGSGSSVMLALAAYNLGPTKVRRILRKVEDPIKQRNFWYLYRVKALPEETREYVPKIISAIIIGRNPKRFGFQTQDGT